MQFSQEERFAMHRTQNEEKVPLTRREHVNHVVEGHWTIVSIIEIILLDLNYYWNVDFDQDVNYSSLAATNV